MPSRSGEQPKKRLNLATRRRRIAGLLARDCEPSCRRSSVDAARSSEPSQDLLSDDWVGTTTILSDRSRLTPSSLPSRASGFVQHAVYGWWVNSADCISNEAPPQTDEACPARYA